MKKNTLVFLLLPMLWSCVGDSFFEAKHDFDNGNWSVDEQIQFEFEVETNAIVYELYLSLRHTLDYPFHNLYFQYQLIDQDENILKERLVNLELFDSKTGRPIGSGIGVYRDLETRIEEGISLNNNGKYKVVVMHYMRPDVLQGIQSIGIKVSQNATHQTND
jgi:gliding motility-associated lipoprotein GldH